MQLDRIPVRVVVYKVEFISWEQPRRLNAKELYLHKFSF